MSFNQIMAEWLTFLDNKSLQHDINAGLKNHPDENYGEFLFDSFVKCRVFYFLCH